MSTEDIDHVEAWKKLRSFIDDIKISMMITGFDKKPISAVPMRTKKMDQDGNIWFLSSKTSEHNEQLSRDKNIQLLYVKADDMKFMSVYGTAEVTTESKVLEDLYSSVSDNWFEGLDDPNLTAIKVTPQDAYYWDSKSNKYMTLLKLGVGAIGGPSQDIGKKGRMDL